MRQLWLRRASESVRSRSVLVHNFGGVCLLALALGLGPVLLGSANLSSSRTIELPFLTDQSAPVVLAFAGFAGCGGVCPTGLADMALAYQQLSDVHKPRVELLFVDVHANTPAELSLAYAQGFDPAFRAHAVRDTESDLFEDVLGLRTYPDAEAAASHPGYLYLFSRDAQGWRVNRFYRQFPVTSELAGRLSRIASEYG